MLSQTSTHAIHAVRSMAMQADGEYVGAASLAEAIGAPSNYLGKLLAVLADRGVLESRRGLGGGFRLARPAEEISVYEVVAPFDRLERWADCVLSLEDCSDENPCALHDMWKVARERCLEMLHESTVAHLRDSPKGPTATTSG